MDTNSTIEIQGTGTFTRWTCDICGELQDKDGVNSRVVFEVNGCGCDYDICRACLDAGIQGAAERSIKRAEKLEEWAALHRAGIPDVLRAVTEWKSGKDYDAAREQWEREYLEAVKGDAAPARVYDFPDGWDSEWQPSFDEPIPTAERKELDALNTQRGALTAQIDAMDKAHNHCGYCKTYTDAPHNHCVDCGTLEGELHKPNCEHEFCPKCGEQLSVCKHNNDNDFQEYSRLPFGFFEHRTGGIF